MAHPSVGLLSIGEEPEKGNRLAREAHAVLVAAQASTSSATSRAETSCAARRRRRVRRLHGQHGAQDARGHDQTTLDVFREEVARLAARQGRRALIRPAARAAARRLDPDTYGGAYLLGLRGLVVIAHGNSSRTAIANAIRYGARGVRGGVVDRVDDRLDARGGETAAP